MTTTCIHCKECTTGTLPDSVRAYALDCIGRRRARSYLIPVLHRLQSEIGYLRESDLREVADIFGITPAEVKGVVTFYHYFTLKPRGKHAISVCLGTACHVRGATEVLKKIEALLGIVQGETTSDGLFSIESARCLGMCALAPVVTVSGKVYGNVTVDGVAGILREHGYEGEC